MFDFRPILQWRQLILIRFAGWLQMSILVQPFVIVVLMTPILFTQCASQTEAQESINRTRVFESPFFEVHKTNETIIVDGVGNEKAWQKTHDIGSFGDIIDHDVEAKEQTHVKLLWDEKYFYVLAKVHAKDIWARIKQRDSTIYLDPAFEIFIDCNLSGRDYLEFEFNALNTLWDLGMNDTYKNGGRANSAIDIHGLKSAVSIHGSINQADDQDSSWIIEIALPIEELLTHTKHQKGSLKVGYEWRVNFMRVHWEMRHEEFAMRKGNQKQRPDFSTWVAHGKRNAHIPSKWGRIKFVNEGNLPSED